MFKAKVYSKSNKILIINFTKNEETKPKLKPEKQLSIFQWYSSQRINYTPKKKDILLLQIMS